MAEWVRHEGVRWQSGLDMMGCGGRVGAVAEWVTHEGVRWQSGLDMKGRGGRVG